MSSLAADLVHEYCSRPENLGKSEQNTNTFQWQDYLILGLVLSISGFVGIYFAYKDRNKDTAEYMMGGGNVSPLPIALSLATTFFSAITILTTPVEYYRYGTMFAYNVVCYFICTCFAAEVFGPMYQKFGLTSLYEYLELRFNRYIRYFVSVEYMVQNIIYIGMVIYTPAVALEIVTGLGRWEAVWLTGGICIFYTSIGGLKAVVWTDSFQICIMLAGFVAFIIKGSIDFGMSEILETFRAGDRNVWNDFSFDPRVRHTFWSIVAGGVVGQWGNAYCTSQSMVQRMLACKDHKNMRIALYTAWSLSGSILILGGAVGMVLYKYYECCDPYLANWVDSRDQLLPYLATDIFESLPGMAGLYVAAAFSGTLSTVSSGINSITTCFITDFIRLNEKHIFGKEKPDNFYMWMGKIMSVVFGLFCIGFAYIASKLGGILQAATAINSMFGGPTFAVFILGFFFPWTEPIGVSIGYILGLANGIWVYLGSTQYPPYPEFTNELHTEIVGCKGFENVTCEANNIGDRWCPTEPDRNRPGIADYYSMSYIYVGTLGCLTTILVGNLVSLIVSQFKDHTPNDLPQGVLFPAIDKLYKRNDMRQGSVGEKKSKNMEESKL